MILSVCSLFVGVLDIRPSDLLIGSVETWEIFLISRLPRLLAILCTGIGMSVAGLIMQQLCMNKFVSPTTGATISSAQFGILLALLFAPGSTLWGRAAFSFVCAVLGTWVFVWFIQRIQFKDVVMVPLVGIMFSNIVMGVTNYLAYKYEMTQALSSWLVGHFSTVIRGRYELVWLTVPLVVLAFVFANHFNIVGMGKDFSQNLGVPYDLVLFMGLTIAAMITASVVVVVGSISYIGLIVRYDRAGCDLSLRAAHRADRWRYRQYPVCRSAAVSASAWTQGSPAGQSCQENRRCSMKTHKNHLRLLILLLLVLLACVGYMTVGVHFENQKLFAYAMRIRTPKLIAMLITAFAIGSASIVFQSIINNTIVTPCLLGMDQLYSLIHTAVFFVAGSGSFLAVNANAAFAVDLAIMGAVATVIYSYLFQKTNHNVLYVLLIGTVLTSFFSSIQTTLTRVMDPNEYDTLLTDLVASFSNVNSAILVLSVVVLALVAFAFRKELVLLDVLTLGKDQAINLGVDYDRCIRRLLLGVTLYIATATAMVGPLAFLGLIIANLSRQFLRTYRHSQLITGSVLFGMAVLIGGQLLVERVYSYSVPVSVFITVGGGVYFLYLLLTQRKA